MQSKTIITDFARKPSSDTIAYYQFNGNLNDSSGNNRNLSMYTGSFGYGTTTGGAKYVITNTSACTNNFSMPIDFQKYTLSCRAYFNEMRTTNQGIIVEFECGNQGRPRPHTHQNCILAAAAVEKTPGTANTRYYIVITGDGTGYTAYLNGNLMTKIKSGTIGTAGKGILIGNNVYNYDGNGLIGSLSNVIIEKVIWSQQEITSYLKKMKSLYGIS